MSQTAKNFGEWFIDPIQRGIVRFNDDPTTGILVGTAPMTRLVSAAPDLLGVAELVIELVDGACLVERDHPQARLADLLRAAFAATAKVKG